MEKPKGRVRKDHPMLISCFYTFLIHDTSTGRCEVFYPTFSRPVNVVWEWEESIARARDVLQLGGPCLPFCLTQAFYGAFEEAVPLGLLPALELFATNEEVDGVGFFSALYSLLEGKRKDAWVVAQPPDVGFPACETRAMDA